MRWPRRTPRRFRRRNCKKILKFIDTIGVKQEFPPPTAQSLAISSDPNQTLPVIAVVTDDQKVYFCRSQLNADDYIIWAHPADSDTSYIFLTRSDLKLIRALYLEGAEVSPACRQLLEPGPTHL